MSTAENLRQVVRNRYGAIASQVSRAGDAGPSCCGPTSSGPAAISAGIYEAGQVDGLPGAAVMASLGCGNPTALAELSAGETVLDLGSGGGIDVLLAGRRVGPAGHAYGLDMTDEMLALARENQRRAGLANVTFLKGEIEKVPLPDAAVDVVISNCVINLAPDKDPVLAEAFRVLRPGGRFAVSDIVRRREVAPALQRNMELWTGCLAGSLRDTDYRAKLLRAGFVRVEITPTRIYDGGAARELLPPAARENPGELDAAFMSAFVRAVKPQAT
jgi:SAM-dependent methyltransferase